MSTKAVLSQDLLPCPFCGSTDIVTRESCDMFAASAGCSACSTYQAGPTVGAAIERWNRRASLRAALAEGERADKPVAELTAYEDQPAPDVTLYDVIILDRSRCTDGMKLYARPSPAALRAAVIEECAQACDARADEHKYGPMWNSRKGEEADACATAIRALKEKA